MQCGSFWDIYDYLSRQNRLISIVSKPKNLICGQTKICQEYFHSKNLVQKMFWLKNNFGKKFLSKNFCP